MPEIATSFEQIGGIVDLLVTLAVAMGALGLVCGVVFIFWCFLDALCGGKYIL